MYKYPPKYDVPKPPSSRYNKRTNYEVWLSDGSCVELSEYTKEAAISAALEIAHRNMPQSTGSLWVESIVDLDEREEDLKGLW